MNVLIRADASIEIGSGHLMRCLTLADQLRSKGASVAFVCRDLPGALFELLQNQGYPYAALPKEDSPSQASDAEQTREACRKMFPAGFDWIVVDHYGLNAIWEHMMRSEARKIMVIDDLANRPHDCDLLLDQNYYRDLERRYRGLVPDACVNLLGPSYVLLRQEFVDARVRLRARDGHVRRIMVFFGGSDPSNQTKKTLDAISMLSRPDIKVDVIVGASNPRQDEIRAICQQRRNVQYHCQIKNMAELISLADVAIGAGGATTWERSILGLPTLTVVFADNQLETTKDLHECGAVVFLGWVHELTATDITHSLRRILEGPELLIKLSEKASGLMKGWVGAESVVNAMESTLNIDQGSIK